MAKIKIGIAGFDKNKEKKLKSQFKKISFIILNKKNFTNFKDLDAIIIFTEGGIANCIDDFFLNNQYEGFHNLKWFHLSRAGVEEYSSRFNDLNFMLTCGEIIQGPNVSEHCLALLLYISRGLRFVKDKKKLLKKRPLELYNKNALIIGLGGIGRMIAQKLDSFGIKVSSVDVNYTSHSHYIEKSYLFDDFQNIIKNFDIVINSCSLTNKTLNLFDKKTFNKMKNNSILINISRGKCVNTKDLMSYLDKKKFYGVGLDVIDPEPLPQNHKIRKYEEVFYTEHTAGWSENLDRRFELVLKNIKRFQNKEKLINIVKEY